MGLGGEDGNFEIGKTVQTMVSSPQTGVIQPASFFPVESPPANAVHGDTNFTFSGGINISVTAENGTVEQERLAFDFKQAVRKAMKDIAAEQRTTSFAVAGV